MRFAGTDIANEIQDALDKGASYKEIRSLADSLIFETNQLKNSLRPRPNNERLKKLAERIAEVGNGSRKE